MLLSHRVFIVCWVGAVSAGHFNFVVKAGLPLTDYKSFMEVWDYNSVTTFLEQERHCFRRKKACLSFICCCRERGGLIEHFVGLPD